MELRAESRRRRLTEAGFSLPELMIASVIFLVLVLGIVPLFLQAIRGNRSAGDATASVNFARSQLEEYLQLPFNHALLAPNADNPLEEYYSLEQQEWVAGTAPTDGSDPAEWTRVTTVRQYHISALDDGTLDTAGEALDASADPGWVNLKQVQVRLDRQKGSVVSSGPDSFTFEVLKSQ